MLADWETHSVGELELAGCLLVEDGNHGEYRPQPDEFGHGKTAFIRAADMSNGRVLFETATRINDTAVARVRKGIGRGGDVLLSHKGTVGKLALVPLDAPPFVCSPQTTFWRTLNEDRLDRRYLYFFMASRAFTTQWQARKGETDMADYVSLTAQRQLRVVIPPIGEQRAIANAMEALEDKLELNCQMNRTLEALATSLFKSWFMDFDPVVAKADKRVPPVLSAGTADLFPDLFIQSKLGAIPAGWRTGRISDVLTLAYGKALKDSDRRQGSVPVYGSNGQVGWHDTPLVQGPGIIVGRKGSVGFVTWSESPFFPIDTTFYVVPKSSDYGLRFLFGLLSALDLPVLSGDSAVPGLNRDVAHSADVIVPPAQLAGVFECLSEPLHRMVWENQKQSRVLTSLRDTLLTELVCGQIRVDRAERLIEAAI